MGSYKIISPISKPKPVCLICSDTMVIFKSNNVKRHYEMMHKSFEQTYPLKSKIRAPKTKAPTLYNTIQTQYRFMLTMTI